jgi:hypothetical protein
MTATTTLSPVPPLTPALSPEYRGEGVNTRPLVALIPTGRLSLLPLHATVLGELTVTYAASAMALAVARDTACARSGGAAWLAGVGNPLPGAERLTELRDALRTALTTVPETAEPAQPRAELARLLDFPVDALMQEGRYLIPLVVQIYAAAGKAAERLLGLALQWPSSLPHARAELESIADMLPNGHSRTLYEHQAGRQPLLDALAGANLVHLSCHGQFQPDDPLESGLLLADGQLTLREILAPGFTALDSARLAVLSACQTAIADFRNLPDESIGLPAGLTQAGVPSVVGTRCRKSARRGRRRTRCWYAGEMCSREAVPLLRRRRRTMYGRRWTTCSRPPR